MLQYAPKITESGFISMSETPKNNPIAIISLLVVELLSIKELMAVGRRSG
jgi:hypothetical protein